MFLSTSLSYSLPEQEASCDAAGIQTHFMNPVSVSEGANSAIIEDYHQRWLENADSVDPTWRAFFQGFTLGSSGQATVASANDGGVDGVKQSGVYYLISAYRTIGHFQAHINPLGGPPPLSPKLALATFRLDENDLETEFDTGNFRGGGRLKLRDLLGQLQQTYCEHTGVEYTHIQDQDCRRWLQDRIESTQLEPDFNKTQKIRILRRVHKAELFEKFLHTKYVGQKRFSLEGGETIIAALDAIIDYCPQVEIEEIVMGMAHRGRLNVLCSVMRKSFDLLFEQFSDNYIPDSVAGDGDVKYHLGYESILETSSGKKVEVRLAANPSHLEIAGPVVEGKARARQRHRGDTAERRLVMPLLIHGDAAIAGQGIVAEMLQFSQIPGYRTGGTLHFVINNQIGFTTDPVDSRSSRYCTDVAKTIEAPIFHVNGDDPEEVCMVAQLAVEFRRRWSRDVFIDMYCYRKHGHNEMDEPSFTQPIMYQQIAGHEPVSTHYTQQLIGEGSLTEAEGEAIKAEYSAALDENLAKAKTREATKTAKRKSTKTGEAPDPYRGSTAVFQRKYHFTKSETGVALPVLDQVVKALTTVPDGFTVHPKIRRFVDGRAKAHQNGGPYDWGMGEALAYGTLLLEGIPVRLSGQDCQRGTFTHRHAVFNDHANGSQYLPLNHLGAQQAKFCVYNSLLSEAAVLAFDHGYALDYPEMLVLWEAQFGDFANGAQVVIDQFISSAESKWQRTTGITLLLPHGYEGQGPEHSSARLERFLQLCAEDNIQVANLTTPAQFFHMLRRQMKRDFKKPLIIMSPKSLLRHPVAVSSIADFTEGSFQEIIGDPLEPAQTERVILCSGKVYYDLCDHREQQGVKDTAIIRVEQLYPLHQDRLSKLADTYGRDVRLVWCQEEPQNMGAWSFMAPQLEECFGRKPVYAGRDAAASPAVGVLAIHRLQLATFLQRAFTV